MNDVKKILTKYRFVAIVGLSMDPSKDRYKVAEYLKNHGFHVVPVNPLADEVLGEKSYKSLIDLPLGIQKSLEIVDIFRPPQEVPSIVEQAVKLKTAHGKPHVIWMQLGIHQRASCTDGVKSGNECCNG